MKLLGTVFTMCTLCFSVNALALNEDTTLNNQATVANAQATDNQFLEVKKVAPKTIYEAQVGDAIYVSESANVWLRACPDSRCKINAATHVGEKFSFVKFSTDQKFVLVDDGNKQQWMQTRDVQVEPCGKAKVEILEGKVAELQNKLDNYDSVVAKDYQSAKAKLEKLEKENAQLKDILSKQNTQIEDLDATRRDFADRLETKELDMQMRWWLQGAVIAFCGAIIGIICVYIPRPRGRKKSRDNW